MADVKQIVSKVEQLSSDRLNFETQWQEVAERIDPASVGLFRGSMTKGAKNTELIFDSTASIAWTRFGAILDSLLTPRNQTWHRIIADNSDLMKSKNVRLYFEEANRTLFKYRYLPMANFTSQNQKDYLSLGGYGTAAMFIDEMRDGFGGIRYKNIHLSEFYFSENHQGIPDEVYRKFKMTTKQIKQRFKNIPDKVSSEKNDQREFDVIHGVYARVSDYDPNRLDYRGMKWASCYVLCDGNHLLEEGGYTSFPYAVSRYDQSPIEIYGRGPAMMVLPTIKTLNEQKKTILKQGQRIVDPVLLVHDDGVADGFSMRAGALNIGGVNKDGREMVKPLVTGRVDIGRDMMEDEKAVIKDAFLVSLFQILVENPQMSATEVLERSKEKGMLLAPTIGRQHTEKLGPTIEREIDILSKQGKLPPMPPELREAKGDYKIEYDSPISRAQRSEEAAGLMRTVENALAVVNVTQNPEPLDYFNWDVIIPEVASIQGTPERWMRSMEQVQGIRQGRAQQMQEQQAIQAAPAVAGLMKASGK
jgi:hypothetical protein